MKRSLLIGPVLTMAISTAWSAACADGHVRQADAHVHGVTALNVAVEGGVLLVELDSPAMNIVGFEHQPRNDEQRRAVATAVERLEGASGLLVTNRQAECRLTTAAVTSELTGEHHGDDHHDDHHDEKHHDDEHHDDEHHGDEHHGDEHHDEHHAEKHHDHDHHGDEEVHSEFRATYELACASPDRLRTLELGFIEAFPGIERIDVQLVTATTQRRLQLREPRAAIDLR